MNKTLIIFLAIFSLFGCSTLLETTRVPDTGSSWKIINVQDYGKGKGALVERIPINQEASSWSSLLGVQFLEGTSATPKEVMLKLESIMRERCDNTEWKLIEELQDRVVYEWGITNCEKAPPQHEIATLIQGNEGIHRVAYVEKSTSMSSETRLKWIDLLKSSYVHKGGEKIMLNPNKSLNQTGANNAPPG